MKKLGVYFPVLILILLIFFGGYFVGNTNSGVSGLERVSADNEVDLKAFWKTWDLIDEKYIAASSTKEISNTDRIYGAISGMVESLDDPYTTFLPPKENNEFREIITGNFSGVGMEVGMEDELITVISPLKNTPAQLAGIQSGDIVVEIDNISTVGMSLDAAVDLIRGEVGSEVILTILREGEEELLEIPIIRDVINIPTLDTELRDDVFIISFYNFSAMATTEFRNALREFIEAGTPNLILDLRGNPGGFLQAATDIASWFLPAGKVIVQEKFSDDNVKNLRSKGYNIFNEDLNMVVLVNRGSASASEILAGALQEYNIATIVGTQTFGKGSVQELIDITPETSLKVTIARWLTPNGKSISDGGLTPDVIVDEAPEGVDLLDYQLQEAIKILKN